jgi:hypothetical protein
MLLGRFLVVLLSFSVLGASLVVACGEAALPQAERMDAMAPETSVGDGVCPSALPSSGDPCLLPEGTTCAFGSCPLYVVRCTRAAWVLADTAAPASACPEDAPTMGSSCPPCWPETLVCRYSASTCGSVDAGPDASGDAGFGEIVAACARASVRDGMAGRWTLSETSCGAQDAGADVQRDAEPDAD